MNTMPEWFTDEPDQTPYLVYDAATNQTRIVAGRRLCEGLPVRLAAGETLRLTVTEKSIT